MLLSSASMLQRQEKTLFVRLVSCSNKFMWVLKELPTNSDEPPEITSPLWQQKASKNQPPTTGDFSNQQEISTTGAFSFQRGLISLSCHRLCDQLLSKLALIFSHFSMFNFFVVDDDDYDDGGDDDVLKIHPLTACTLNEYKQIWTTSFFPH